MSIYGAMFSGVTGLAAQSQALGMISDNISNVNTIGYKGTVARFQTLVTEASSTTTYSPGGVRSTPFQKIDRQGLLQGSSSPYDLAIIGNGMFVVNEDAAPGIGDDYLFTRAGNFAPNQNGDLVSSSGYYLQGWRLDTNGNLPTNTTTLNSLNTVNISNLTGSARSTSAITIAANLPGSTAAGDTHSITAQVYDKQGSTENLTFTWVKTSKDNWALMADLPGNGQFATDDTTGATLSGSTTTYFPMATLADTTDFSLASATGNVSGAAGTFTVGTPVAGVSTITTVIGGITYTGTVPTDSGTGNDLTGASSITFTGSNGSTFVLDLNGATTYDIDPTTTYTPTVTLVGTEFTFAAPSNTTNNISGVATAATVNAPAAGVCQIDVVIGGVTYTANVPTDSGGGNDLAPASVISFTAVGGRSMTLTLGGGAASYDLDGAGQAALQTALQTALDTGGGTVTFANGAVVTNPDLATLQTNLDDAFTGVVFANNSTSGTQIGTISFNADGSLQAITAVGAYATINAADQFEFYVDYDSSALTTSTSDRQLVSLDLGTLGFSDGLTQYSGAFYPSVLQQDGLSFGSFTGITIDENGIVTALFDNGQQRDIYKLPLATFPNPNGLQARNGNAYLQTNQSGNVLLLEANTGGSGEIAPNSLESSTVDLAEEFTNMIITQRAYSASAKVITTADEMLDELIRIRR